MGATLSALKMYNTKYRAVNPRAIDEKLAVLLMADMWKENDAMYEGMSLDKEKLQNRKIGEILWTITKFMPCQVKNCNCKGGSYEGVMRDSFGYKNNMCITPGCNHLQTDHMLNLMDASRIGFTSLVTLVFDLINIKGTLENESKNPKCERNLILENILNLISEKITKCIRLEITISFDIDKLFGAPPFENTNIEQILLNFCMHAYSHDTTELKRFLIVTKFVIRYFDSWIWPVNNLSVPSSNQCSKSYHFYYQRFLLRCFLPRCVRSNTLRYRPSMIFGQDVLRYALTTFREKLQAWCSRESIIWTSLTKSYCLDYLSIYMNELEKQVYADKSPIWDTHYCISDFKNIFDSALMRSLCEE